MMHLKMSRPIQPGSAVKIEADDTMSLGEVNCCRPEGDSFVVGVELFQALHNVTELTRLARALLS